MNTSRLSLVVICLLALVSLAGTPQRVTARTTISQTAPAPRCNWIFQSYDDFYTEPEIPADSPLGNVLRVEHIRTYTRAQVADAAGLAFSQYGAEVYRVLYLSQTALNTPQIVSGLMLVPDGAKPVAGFPVIAYGHGTTGMADSTAPSRTSLGLSDILGWMAKGYIVSATDYPGLGMPGSHPYLVGEVAAYSMLDAARAALRFCDVSRGIRTPSASNRIILAGHSQGGHAALFAQQVWPRYAADLEILGTVIYAPVSELRRLVTTMSNERAALVGPATLTMYAYSQYYGGPESLTAWLKEPYATQLPERAESRDIFSLSLWLGFNPERVFEPTLLTDIRAENWADTQPWTGYLDTNTPGNFASDIPVLVIQGQKDLIIPPETSKQLKVRLCSKGTQAQLISYPNAGHSVVNDGFTEVAAWVADRLAGTTAEGTCQQQTWLPLVGR